MGYTTIRQAVYDYLNAGTQANGNGAITFLSQVYAKPRKFTPDLAFTEGEDPGTQSGALIFLHFGTRKRQRITLGGLHGGQKFVTYDLTMICKFRTQKPLSEDAVTDNDTFMDALTTYIEADRLANAPGVIWQWGEGGINGGTDIDSHVDLPHTVNQGVTGINSLVYVTVTEWLTQQG